MTKTNVDLQPIREKLQMLKAELPAAEAISSPWSAPRSTAAEASHRQPASSGPQPRAAIETLQQRSGNRSAAREASPSVAQIDSLVAQEIHELEVRAHQINLRSQQQTADIMAMKRAAQQAAVTLARRGIHKHPQLAAIAQLFENEQAAVPHVEKTAQGHFVLTHSPIDFQRAEQEAIDTAEALRNRQALSAIPFNQPIAAESPVGEHWPPADAGSTLSHSPRSNGADWLQALAEDIIADCKRWFWRGRRRGHRSAMHPGNRPSSHAPSGHFSWLDGAIWFSSAAIARIVIEAVLVSHPFLRTPLLVVLVGAIAVAIYRVVFAKSSDFGLAYRLSAALLGLFLGGSF
ncbi:hypothetical protein [Leptolyngbya sp. BC1307]|uniref:hypothetical protein n=1 Tax=Leptolyngbya sp. BC1307 TaxID=2029589 RepID=UPI000EFD4D95|nr:hypothetical protein [Leptolyngbya sp. BC1307]